MECKWARSDYLNDFTKGRITLGSTLAYVLTLKDVSQNKNAEAVLVSEKATYVSRQRNR